MGTDGAKKTNGGVLTGEGVDRKKIKSTSIVTNSDLRFGEETLKE